MKKILWVSRHVMTSEQVCDLERVMGDSIEILQYSDTVRDVAVLVPFLTDADAVAVVLPPELISDLLPLAADKPVLRSVSGRQPNGKTVKLPDGREEPQFDFIHVCWEQILACKIVTKRL